MDTALKVELEVNPQLSLVARDNGIPLLLRVRVEALAAFTGLRALLYIESEPSARVEIALPELGPGQVHLIEGVEPPVDDGALASQLKPDVDAVVVEIVGPRGTVMRAGSAYQRRPAEEWPGSEGLVELLAAFVRPAAPGLADVDEQVRAALFDITDDPGLSAYESHDCERVLIMAEAIHDAMSALEDRPSPAPFKPQIIRAPGAVLATGNGSPLERACAQAAALERIGLHPMVVIFDDRVFVGVWTIPYHFPSPTSRDPWSLRRRVELGEATLWDPLQPTRSGSAALARTLLTQPERFIAAVDVVASREAGIRPLLSGPAPGSDASERSDPSGAIVRDRVTLWSTRLLDQSLRNPLVNFRATTRTVPLLIDDLGSLAARLGDGESMVLGPRPPELGPDAPRTAPELARLPGDSALRRALNHAHTRAVLPTDLSPIEFDRCTRAAWSANRARLEETGSNGLFLVVGLLHWFESKDSEQLMLAPLLMLPADLVRSSDLRSYYLRLRDEPALVNPALVRRLQQEYAFTIEGIDPLPRTAVGVDARGVLAAIEAALPEGRRWQVDHRALLGTFDVDGFQLWSDLRGRKEIIQDNPVVSRLSLTRKDPAPVLPALHALEAWPADQRFCPLPSDSSQRLAVLAARRGHSFVLLGAPGTGKSQTIANLIAQFLADDKRILFVSQKQSALDVVRRRLEEIGVAEWCLDLHGEYARKAGVVRQLGRALATSAPAVDEWTPHCRTLDGMHRSVDAVLDALHRPRLGHSLAESVDRLVQLTHVPNLPWSPDGDIDAAVPPAESAIHALGKALARVGHPPTHPFEGCTRSSWRSGSAAEVSAGLSALEEAAEALLDKAEAFRAALGAPLLLPTDALDVVAAQLEPGRTPPQSLLRLDDPAPLAALIDTGRQRAAEWNRIAARWSPDILTRSDLAPIATRFSQWADAFFLFAWVMLFGARSQLAPSAKGALPDNARITADLHIVQQVRRLQHGLEDGSASAKALLGSHWRGAQTRWDQVAAMLETSRAYRGLRRRLEEAGHEAAALEELDAALGRQEPGAEVRATRDAYRDAAAAYEQALATVRRVVPHPALETTDPDALLERVAMWEREIATLPEWVMWVQASEQARAAGFAALVDAVMADEVAVEEVPRIADRAMRLRHLEHQLQKEPGLAEFQASELGERLDALVDAERLHRDLAKRELRARLAGRVAAIDDEEALELLQSQLELVRGHLPIRALMRRLGPALGRLAPCVMVAPRAVSAWLESSTRFDLVIIDEASQLTPWDAVSALARGEQAVIVGDRQQLPPTQHFQTVESDLAPEEEEEQDQESILDTALNTGVPKLTLAWHYRSLNEDLFRFSNRAFYADQINVFPSAHPAPAGLSLHRVPNGFYDRGRTRVNEAEARSVVDELLYRIRSEPERSVGVICLSRAQQRRVEELLEQARGSNPELELHFSTERDEPVFVKSLERAQGDCRDTILLSVGYAPDRDGQVSMHFGGLVRKGGERRLNVAITRARSELVLFTSLEPEHIEPSRTRARGILLLRELLLHVQDPSHRGGERAAESGVVRALRDRLELAGVEVSPGQGHRGGAVDLCVRAGMSEYAIATDGPAWSQAATLHDRVVLRDEVLTARRWRVERVWGLQWWLDPEGVVRGLGVGDEE